MPRKTFERGRDYGKPGEIGTGDTVYYKKDPNRMLGFVQRKHWPNLWVRWEDGEYTVVRISEVRRVLAGPKGRLPNSGRGKAFTFHGSFASKILAARKERSIPGSFIHEKDGRYYVLKPKKIASATFYEPRNARRNASVPKGAVKIYGRCLRIEAVKLRVHSYGGKETGPGQKYFHDFTTKNAMIYGLPDGSLLIKAR